MHVMLFSTSEFCDGGINGIILIRVPLNTVILVN